MWDMYGLEQVKAISKYENCEHENLIRVLKDEKPFPNPVNEMLFIWVNRARFNTDRHYEVWAVDCGDPTLTEDDWYDMFESNPQVCVDLIRSKGVCFHSDKLQKEKVVIQ